MSTQHTFQNVEENQVNRFVREHLSGSLTLAGKSDSLLSYHLPKSHGFEKTSRHTYGRTYTGGCLTYNPKTGTMCIRTANEKRKTQFDILQLWHDFSEDPTPPWQKVKSHPSKFHNYKKDSGKYKGQRFQTIYKKTNYVDWMLSSDGQRLCRNSLGMRMLFEYCNGRRQGLEEDETASGNKAPKQSRRRSAEEDDTASTTEPLKKSRRRSKEEEAGADTNKVETKEADERAVARAEKAEAEAKAIAAEAAKAKAKAKAQTAKAEMAEAKAKALVAEAEKATAYAKAQGAKAKKAEAYAKAQAAKAKKAEAKAREQAFKSETAQAANPEKAKAVKAEVQKAKAEKAEAKVKANAQAGKAAKKQPPAAESESQDID
eukprot:TRINITY_DN31329_c0_g1_i1.p1 TRINITY_DN31329_c0_g1~~TRINITY_DN31329_c0_g1_i1.p1  ORF type:complete len:404 (-),score=115.04 TRINITY_DN31329_c0_g1_i1:249-1370(-)